jgi:hypothetical protein
VARRLRRRRLLQALDATLTSDGGWSLDLSEPVLARALCHVDNAYFVPHVRLHGRIARTHKTSQTAFRGFGGPQGMMVVEDVLGRCAPLLGVAADDLRRRNFYVEGQTTPYGQVVRHPQRLARAWQQLLDTARFAERTAEVERFNAEHEHRKRGLAVTPVKFGISFNFTAFNQAGALVHVYKDGSVLVNHGGTEMGQGLHTKMLQVAATALGVPWSTVRLAPTRTDKVPNTSATAASSGADLNGGAVKHACEQLRSRLAEVAAVRLGTRPEDVRFVDGTVRGSDPDGEQVPWAEVVRLAYFARVPLSAAGFYRTEGLRWDSTRMQGEPFKYFAYGVAAAEVEVDGFDGSYRTRRVDIVHDAGDSLSPLIDIGQIEGGFVQGAGWLTLEDLRWDESDGPARGRLATQAASTYKLPSLSEMPEEFSVALLEDAAEDGAVYGSKGVGEPPLMLAFSVREALRQAAAAFGPPGTSVDLASPATPEVVWWALQRARRAAPADGAGASADGLLEGRARASSRPSRLPAPRRCAPGPSASSAPSPRPEAGVDWLRAVQELRTRRVAGVLVTLVAVRGPRAPGGRRQDGGQRRDAWGTVGGGNLEAGAVTRARALLSTASPADLLLPEQYTVALSDRAPYEHGVQCCGGEVTVLLEPLPVVPAVAVFGVGHVGLELARVLARRDLELHLVDSRPEQLTAERLAVLADARAAVHVHAVPVLPELVLADLPPGTHVLVMTHDHAEDAPSATPRCARPPSDRSG